MFEPFVRAVANERADIWFHRYEDGRDIEGRFDYNSWQESETGKKLSASLDRDVVLAEGKTKYDVAVTLHSVC